MQDIHREFFSFTHLNPAEPVAGFHVLDSAFQVVAGAPLASGSEQPSPSWTQGPGERNVDQLLTRLALRFIHLSIADIDQGIEEALRDIGEFVGVQRCYLLVFRDRHGKVEEVFEWCAPELQTLGPGLIGRPVAAFPWGLEKSVCRALPLPGQGDAAEDPQGCAAAARLLFPVLCGNCLLGFLGLDSLRPGKHWQRGDLDLFTIAGSMLAHVMDRRQKDQEARYSQGFEHLVARIATTFLQEPADAADRGINFAVEEVCRFVQADRCYVFQLQTKGGEMAFTSDWWSLEGEVERLKNWRIEDFPWLGERLRQKETVLVPRVDDLPADAAAERSYWQKRGIQSLIMVPLHSAGALVGGMGFESRQPQRIWREKDPQLLQAVVELIGLALERQKAEDTLRLALADAQAGHDRIAAIFRSAADGLLVADARGRIMLANRAAERLLKMNRKGLLARTLAELSPEFARPERRIFDFQGPGGRILEARSAPLPRRKGGGGTVLLLRDISREREMERLKSEFVATAAHELRTPLTSIQGFAEILLLGKELDLDERQELVKIICEQAESLAEIIADLLDISRIEAGQGMSMRKEECDVAEIVGQAVARLSRTGRQVTVDIPLDLPPVVADRGKLRQVLDNLLSNAGKYSSRESRIAVAARRLPQGTEIVVEDHGIGMTGEQVSRIFERFYRGDGSNAALPGIGLGMSIVWHIVQAHDGQIKVESTPGQGTRVRVVLPG
jgi:signal transduction histidine kinase